MVIERRVCYALIASQVADMSHTEHGCFDECTMGPNVRVGGEDGRSACAPFLTIARGSGARPED